MAAETLGVEEELHLIDTRSRKLSARAPQLLARLPAASYSAELQRTTVETNTAVAHTLAELREDILQLRRGRRPVEFLSLEGEGHEYRRADSRRALIERMVRFLDGALRVGS